MKHLSILSTLNLMVGMSLLASVVFAEAKELYVSPDGDNTTGTLWEYALHTPNEALDVIKNATDDTFTVYISEGEYEVEDNDIYPHIPSFYIYDRCSFIGGWSSHTVQTPEYDPNRYITKITVNEPEYVYCGGSLKGIHFVSNEKITFTNEDHGVIDQCYLQDVVEFYNENEISNSRYICQDPDSFFSNTGKLYNSIVLLTNKSKNGGRVFSRGEITHCTIYCKGNEILNYPTVSNYGIISNSIIWGNSAYDVEPGVESLISYSCFRGEGEGIGNTSFSPLFADISSDDPSQWDLSLSNGSPCIDTARVDMDYSSDINGVSRPGGDGFSCMGAIESPDLFEPGHYPVPGAPDTIFVSPDGNNDGGESWGTAFNSLETAVEVSIEKGVYEIWVAEGTYTSASDQVVTVPHQFEIYGGFIGTETSLEERAGSVTNTIIDGEQERQGAYVVGVLDGFVVQEGRALGGAGVLAEGVIRNCIIQNNYSLGKGGGVFGSNQGTVVDCVILNNTAESDGGGVYEVDVIDSVLAGNHAVNGGGAWNSKLVRSVIRDNVASENGGGCVVRQKEVENSLFYANQALNGGGIYIQNIYIPGIYIDLYYPIKNCTVTKNIATGRGGGVYRDANYLYYHYPIINSVIWNNTEEQANYNDLELSYSCTPDGTSETNSISVDPLFVYAEGDDSEAWDFHLQNDSPCRLSGTAENVPELDLEGKLRAVRNGYAAMGAYTGEVSASVIFSN